MMQFSCYLRFVASKELADVIAERLGRAIPKSGKVDIVRFTDKQYAAIQSFRGVSDRAKPKEPTQLALF